MVNEKIESIKKVLPKGVELIAGTKGILNLETRIFSH